MLFGMSDDPQRPAMPGPDRTPDTALSLQEAAAWAKVNERTLRRWIKSGRLHAAKEDGQYRITVADLVRARHPPPSETRTADRGRPGARAPGVDISDTPVAGHRTVEMPGPDRAPGIDLAPMVSLIERQARELAEYREAAAVWQERARTLEQRLLQLTAGEIVPDTSSDTSGSTERDDTGLRGLWHRVRRLWGE